MQDNKEVVLKGIPASPGVITGKVYLVGSEQYVILKQHIKDEDVPSESKRFKESLAKTKIEILAIKKKMEEEIGIKEAQIFSAHILVIEYTMLIDEVLSTLNKKKLF